MNEPQERQPVTTPEEREEWPNLCAMLDGTQYEWECTGKASLAFRKYTCWVGPVAMELTIQRGTVLNNLRTIRATQLDGWVLANAAQYWHDVLMAWHRDEIDRARKTKHVPAITFHSGSA
jgi:hypothetical protein